MTTRRRRGRRAVLQTAIGLATVVATSAPALAHGDRTTEDLHDLRQATAPFHDLTNAETAEYGLFTDAAGLACILDPQGRGGT